MEGRPATTYPVWPLARLFKRLPFPTNCHRLVLKCHPGCDFTDICKSLKLEPKDLFPIAVARNDKPEIAATYPYTDDKGHMQTIKEHVNCKDSGHIRTDLNLFRNESGNRR